MSDTALDDHPRFPSFLARNLFRQRSLSLGPCLVSLHLQVGTEDDGRLVGRIPRWLRTEERLVRLRVVGMRLVDFSRQSRSQRRRQFGSRRRRALGCENTRHARVVLGKERVEASDTERRDERRHEVRKEPMYAKREHVVLGREPEPGLSALRIDVEQAVYLVGVGRREYPADETTVAVPDDDERSLFARGRQRLMQSLGNHAKLDRTHVAESVPRAVPCANSGDLMGGLKSHDPAAGIWAHLVNFCAVIWWLRIRKPPVGVWDSCSRQVGNGPGHTRGRLVEDRRIVCVILSRPLVVWRELIAPAVERLKVGFP